MRLVVNWPTNLRELIISKDNTLLEKLNPRRITWSDAVSYGIIVHYVSGEIFVDTLIWNAYEWLPIHDLKTISMDIQQLQRVYFDWDGIILVSFL